MVRSKVFQEVLNSIENPKIMENKVRKYADDLINKTYHGLEILSFKHNVRGNIMKKRINGLFDGVETLNDMLNKNACVASGHYNVYSVKNNKHEECIINYNINQNKIC